jgi:adenylate cyclase
MEALSIPHNQPLQILIVDDEPGTLQLLRLVLQADGHTIFQARDGDEAITEFVRIRPDLVLLDILLPKVDGMDVLRAIREQDAVAGVIVITALSSEQLAVQAMVAGADDYLNKPVALKTLRLHIRQVLGRVELRRQNAHLQQQLVMANEKLRRYMAPPLLETLLADPNQPTLGGNRQTVTILFLDFCDFTAATRDFPPDEVVRMMNDYFALLTGAVLDNGGYLDKIMGDGLMALYNMPAPQADHAPQAVRSALEMRRRIQVWNGQRASGLPQLNVRVGIHTGEAVVGNIGTANLMNFTAIGREVNLAKRIEEEAQPGQILLSAGTYALVEPDALGLTPSQVVSAGWRQLHGFNHPVELFEICTEAMPVPPVLETVSTTLCSTDGC